jgi:hypothetical protein
MLNLLKTPARTFGTLFAAVLFSAVAEGAVARPGTVNYTEGQVNIDGRAIGAKDLGSIETAAGSVLQTESNGKAEMLLFPGAFLRLGENSAVRMVTPSLTETRVELMQGKAMVEVDQIAKENRLVVMDNGVDAQLLKEGIYSFDANQPMVWVYDGKAEVQQDDRKVEVGKGKQLALQPNERLKPQKFDRKETDSLYAWSKVRSEYLADVNRSSSQMVFVNGGPGWYSPGWYWNSWYNSWGFFPSVGLAYSPFGYGFYSPSFWYYNPRVYVPRGTWVGRGGRVTPPVVRQTPSMRAPAMRAPSMQAPAMRAPASGGMRRGR